MKIGTFYVYTSSKVGAADNALYLVHGHKDIQKHIPFGVAHDKSLEEALMEMASFIKNNYSKAAEFTIVSAHSINIKMSNNGNTIKGTMNYRLNHQNLERLMNYIVDKNIK